MGRENAQILEECEAILYIICNRKRNKNLRSYTCDAVQYGALQNNYNLIVVKKNKVINVMNKSKRKNI